MFHTFTRFVSRCTMPIAPGCLTLINTIRMRKSLAELICHSRVLALVILVWSWQNICFLTEFGCSGNVGLRAALRMRVMSVHTPLSFAGCFFVPTVVLWPEGESILSKCFLPPLTVDSRKGHHKVRLIGTVRTLRVCTH